MGQDQIDYWVWWELLLGGGEYGQAKDKGSTEAEVGQVQAHEGCTEGVSDTGGILETEEAPDVHEE